MSYAIIGFGKIGQALAKAFARSGIEVSVATTRDPESFASAAAAIGPEKAEDLPPLDPETDIVHGRNPAVSLGEMLDLDHDCSRPRRSPTPPPLRGRLPNVLAKV